MATDKDAYWQSASEDATMQDEHAFIWEAMLDTIDVDLAGRRVLDAGCNRGGFLRLLCRRCELAGGWGYDPAAGAIADARRLAGDLHRGAYYAVMGAHAGSPGVADWHADNVERLNLPPLYTLDEVIAAHAGAGFNVAVSRLKIGFVPLSEHAPSFPAGLEYFYEHKVMLRFVRPLQNRA
jgi:SAM-dependent methyltransferase